MNLCILDAAPFQHPMAALVRRTLLDHAARQRWTPRTFFLPDIQIADCAGDFNCWLKTPGVCSINDANREIARAIVQSGLLVFLTPVTFGGYASELKKALDHIIQDIAPFFESVKGESHHEKRYGQYPRLVGIGLADRADDEAARVFRTVVARNALNMQNDRHASGVLHPGLGQQGIEAEVARLLDAVSATAGETGGASDEMARTSLPHDTALDTGPRPGEWGSAMPAPKSVLVLGGSPRGERSTSASLGRYLVTQLATHGVRADTIEIYAAQRAPEKVASLLAATDQADLIVLSFPLYVDSLPAPVIRMLERIAAHRRDQAPDTRPGAQRFVAIVQCGFPEVRHNDTGLAICREFAREAGFTWAGGLALGGGHGLVHSKPLETLGGKAAHLRKACELAAASLASGRPVPAEAVTLLARPFVPAWLYRMFGNLGWRLDARRLRTSGQLRNRPYGT
jgi:multimeric flavodoxin WrbA